MSKEDQKSRSSLNHRFGEVTTPEAVAALAQIRKLREFWAATLGNRLQIGLQCLKAHHAFVITDQAKKGQGRKGKN